MHDHISRVTILILHLISVFAHKLRCAFLTPTHLHLSLTAHTHPLGREDKILILDFVAAGERAQRTRLVVNDVVDPNNRGTK